MKKLVFELKDTLYSLAFPKKMIKGRKDLLLIILEACRFMMYNKQVANAHTKFILVVDEMNRLFFCTDKKMYSVMFPFHVEVFPSIRFDYNQVLMDSKTLSTISQILESDGYETDDALDFITPIENVQENENKDIWMLLQHLMTYELGYIRYDDDIDGFKKASKAGIPGQHPRYHYDVNLDSQATFKLGLSSQITPDKFIDFLDNKQDRLMLR